MSDEATPQVYTDIEIECKECKALFTWKSGEQRYYAKRAYARPKRCEGCREARKTQVPQDGNGAE